MYSHMAIRLISIVLVLSWGSWSMLAHAQDESVEAWTNPEDPWEYDTTGDQSGGWRQRYHSVMGHSTYGLMPHAGMVCTMSIRTMTNP